MNDAEKKRIYDDRVQGALALDPFVSITLGGTAYKLEYDNSAIKQLYVQTGFNLLSEALTQKKLGDPDFLSIFLFLGLAKHQPNITGVQVDGFINPRHLAYLINRLREAVSLFMPDMSDLEPKEEEDKDGAEHPTKALTNVG